MNYRTLHEYLQIKEGRKERREGKGREGKEEGRDQRTQLELEKGLRGERSHYFSAKALVFIPSTHNNHL